MGFRSTFITEDYHLPAPKWFVDKWKGYIHFGISHGKKDEQGNQGSSFPLSSTRELKTYNLLQDSNEYVSDALAEDIQKLIQKAWKNATDLSIVLIWLHECGGITRVEISKENITYTEPVGWKKTDDITHSYCYGCSDSERATT